MELNREEIVASKIRQWMDDLAFMLDASKADGTKIVFGDRALLNIGIEIAYMNTAGGWQWAIRSINSMGQAGSGVYITSSEQLLAEAERQLKYYLRPLPSFLPQKQRDYDVLGWFFLGQVTKEEPQLSIIEGVADYEAGTFRFSNT